MTAAAVAERRPGCSLGVRAGRRGAIVAAAGEVGPTFERTSDSRTVRVGLREDIGDPRSVDASVRVAWIEDRRGRGIERWNLLVEVVGNTREDSSSGKTDAITCLARRSSDSRSRVEVIASTESRSDSFRLAVVARSDKVCHVAVPSCF